MRYDISFAARFDKIIRDIPGIEVAPPLRRNEDMRLHVQAHRKYPVVIFENANSQLNPFEWGVTAGYMNTPEKIKKMRSQMCNARSEKIIEDLKSYGHRLRKTRSLVPATGIYEHRFIPFAPQRKDPTAKRKRRPTIGPTFRRRATTTSYGRQHCFEKNL